MSKREALEDGEQHVGVKKAKLLHEHIVEVDVEEEKKEDSWSPPDGRSDDGAFDFFSGQHQVASAGQNLDAVNINATATAAPRNAASDWMWSPLLDVNDIRVFCMDRSTIDQTGSAIRGHFQTVTLDDTLEHEHITYSALSYAWGPTQADGSHLTHSIVVEDLGFRVTAHLHAALLALRRADEPNASSTNSAAVWIDAICIDQQNVMERSRQVMLMDRIYRNAARLYVWLGELNAGPVPIHTLCTDFLISSEHSAVASDQENRLIDAIRHRPYFRRRWVVQEVFSCRGPVTLLLGDHQLGILNLDDVLTEPGTKMQLTIPATSTGVSDLHGQSCSLSSWSSSTRKPLLHNLISYRDKMCSDDRDRVFALKSISTDGRLFDVDYRKDAVAIYTSLAKQYALAGHVLPILEAACILPYYREGWWLSPSNVMAGLPSWVPDWRELSTIEVDEIESDVSRKFRPLRTLTCSLSTHDPEQVTGMAPEVMQMSSTSCPSLKVDGHLFAPCQHRSLDMMMPTESERPMDGKDFGLAVFKAARVGEMSLACGWCFMVAHDLAEEFQAVTLSTLHTRVAKHYCVLGLPPTIFTLNIQPPGDDPTMGDSFRLAGYESELEFRDDGWYSLRLDCTLAIPEKQRITLV